MTWDNQKSTFESQDDVPADQKLTAQEWNEHVDEHGRIKAEGRTDDPDSPEVGEIWYRTDLDVLRRAAPDGSGGVNVVEQRAIFDVPTTIVLEDFEGKTVSDLNTIDFAGSPSFAVVARDGSDWLEIDCARDDIGRVNVGSNGNISFNARFEISNADGRVTLSRGAPITADTLLLQVSPTSGIYLNYDADGTGGTSLDHITPPSSELYGAPVDVQVRGQENGTVTVDVTTPQDTYTLSGSVGTVAPDLKIFGQGGAGASTIYCDYAEGVQDDGELSPDLPGYLKDRNVIISENEPSDTSKLWYDSVAGRLNKYDDGSSSWVTIINGEFIKPKHIEITADGNTISINAEGIGISNPIGSYQLFSNELRLDRPELYLGHGSNNPFVFKSRTVPVVIESDDGGSSVEVSNSGVSMSGDVSGAVESGVITITGDGTTAQYPIEVNTDRTTEVVLTPNNDAAMTKDYLATIVENGSFDLVFNSPPNDGETVEFMYIVA